MTLRIKLALTLLAVAVPLAGGIYWVRIKLERTAIEHGLREFLLAQMLAGGCEACEASPADFPDRVFGPMLHGPRGPRGPVAPGPRAHPGPPHRPRFWAYGPDFRSANPRAPRFPIDLRRKLERGAETAGAVFTEGGETWYRVAARMPWRKSPCAIMIVERRMPEFRDSSRAFLWGLLALGGVVLVAVAVAAGPMVRRIRKLQREVFASARTRYASEVDARGSDEIADLARAFNAAGREVRAYLTELEARERTLRGFVADTTHDVMIPLTVLQGHLAALRKRAAPGAPADRETIRSALEETHYMASLVSNLAAVAKLESGAGRDLRRDTVDLGALVERVYGRHAPLAKMRGIAIDRAVPAEAVTTRGDVTLLEQAVSNVVHNAVRYNREGGHVAILLDTCDTRFELRVSDDGPGVGDDLLHRLPERRFRSREARSREPCGLGLGLAIASDVAARHGFELLFARRAEGGLEVTLRGPGEKAGPHSGLCVVEQQ